MSIKTVVASFALAGLAGLGAKELVENTREQVFFGCESDQGVVKIMEPNRYSLGPRDIHITHMTQEGSLVEYDLEGGNLNVAGLLDAASDLCNKGQADDLIEREAQLALVQ